MNDREFAAREREVWRQSSCRIKTRRSYWRAWNEPKIKLVNLTWTLILFLCDYSVLNNKSFLIILSDILNKRDSQDFQFDFLFTVNSIYRNKI
jgi:hypothetical protein